LNQQLAGGVLKGFSEPDSANAFPVLKGGPLCWSDGPPMRLRGLLLLRTSTIRSYCVSYAEHSRKYFEDDATVENPEKIPHQCAEEGKQALYRGLLE